MSRENISNLGSSQVSVEVKALLALGLTFHYQQDIHHCMKNLPNATTLINLTLNK